MAAAVALTIGTRVYNNGDQANSSHFGTITDIKTDRWGTQVEITPDIDEYSDRTDPYWVPPVIFSPEYKGHSGTRFVTEAAYKAWRAKQFQSNPELERLLADHVEDCKALRAKIAEVCKR